MERGGQEQSQGERVPIGRPNRGERFPLTLLQGCAKPDLDGVNRKEKLAAEGPRQQAAQVGGKRRRKGTAVFGQSLLTARKGVKGNGARREVTSGKNASRVGYAGARGGDR